MLPGLNNTRPTIRGQPFALLKNRDEPNFENFDRGLNLIEKFDVGKNKRLGKIFRKKVRNSIFPVEFMDRKGYKWEL